MSGTPREPKSLSPEPKRSPEGEPHETEGQPLRLSPALAISGVLAILVGVFAGLVMSSLAQR